MRTYSLRRRREKRAGWGTGSEKKKTACDLMALLLPTLTWLAGCLAPGTVFSHVTRSRPTRPGGTSALCTGRTKQGNSLAGRSHDSLTSQHSRRSALRRCWKTTIHVLRSHATEVCPKLHKSCQGHLFFGVAIAPGTPEKSALP